jgi:hypothetical protein
MRLVTITTFLVLLLPALAHCAAPPVTHWEALAKDAGLDDADIKLLAKNKFLVGHQSGKQVFSFYTEQRLPMFITADSLLNGYHVLLEESVLQMEEAQAKKLPGLLRELWTALKKDGLKLEGHAALADAARRRARLVVGVALELFGDKTARDDRTLAPIIVEEAKRVVAAKGTGKPKWLGPSDAGVVALDYSRYAPRGFYTRNEALQRHFRAVSWLQSIPFRVGNDDELLSAIILGAALRSTKGLSEKWRPICRGYQDFLGTGDDWDLLVMEKAASRPDKGLAAVRAALLKEAKKEGGPAINDQLAFVPDDLRSPAEVGFRVLSAYRLPDAVLFARTTDPRQFKRRFPEGLEVCALLGSSFARKRLAGKEADKLRKSITDAKGLLSGKSLHHDYLRCLEALLAPPEKGAPPLFHSEPWAAKKCQTALAGWAQARHTWALQAKTNAHFWCQSREPAGFVEQVPLFYVRMGALARRTAKRLEKQGLMRTEDDEDKKPGRGRTDRLLGLLGSKVARPNLKDLWESLAEACDRLKDLSRAQLRGAEPWDGDVIYMRSYGKILAGIMLYQGNSYVKPKDDAPRLIDVFTSPTAKEPHLEVGIGRPRPLFVLYPYRGKEVLCLGAVLPYYEFTHPLRLDDAAWMKLLDSKDAPKPPAWVRPILSTRAVARPKKDED